MLSYFKMKFFCDVNVDFRGILIGSFWGWSGDFWRLPACRRPSGRRPTRSDRRERSTLEGGSRVAAPPIGGRRPPRGCSIACSILCVRSLAFSILGALAERIKSGNWTVGWTSKKKFQVKISSSKKKFFFRKNFFFFSFGRSFKKNTFFFLIGPLYVELF